MNTPCLYSIVRYAPFAETEEFANIGVVMCAPKKRTFHFILTKSNDARVSAFFRDDTIFPLARDAVARDLKYAQEQSKKIPTADGLANFFNYLTVRKESIFHFSSTRVVLAENPEIEIKRVYDQFINHSNFNKERREEILAKELKLRLNAHAELKNAFKKETFESDLTKFSMPFVARHDDDVLCAIKPLAFVQKEPGNMMEHCDHWVARIRRAATEGLLNLSHVLFTIDGHENPSQSEIKAMDMIRKTFDSYQITHFKHNDDRSIIDFAKSSL